MLANRQADEMKIDSVLPNDDSQQEHHAAVDELQSLSDECGDGVQGISSHDLRASLAIVNGFSAALGASFQDLSDQYREILESDDDAFIAESADRLLMLDADCRFCLSRLHSSIHKLKHRLETENVIVQSDQTGETD